MNNHNNRNNVSTQEYILKEIRDAMTCITDKIQMLEESMGCSASRIVQPAQAKHQMMEDVVLNKGIVLKLMRVGQTTLTRWRYKGLLKYQPKSSREIVYRYDDLMDALRSGRLVSREFDQYAAIKRLTAWYENNV